MDKILKSKRPKKRYVVIKIQLEQEDIMVTRPDLIGVIKFVLAKYERENNEKFKFVTPPWVIMVENNSGLVRCAHLDKDRTIEFLTSITELVHREPDNDIDRTGVKVKVKITTLGTSGTIKAARTKYLNKLK